MFTQRLHQTVDHRRRRQRLLRRVKAQAAQGGRQTQLLPSVVSQERRTQDGALTMGDLIDQHPIQARGLRVNHGGTQRQPTAFPHHAPGNGVDVLPGSLRKGGWHQRTLAIKLVGHDRRHRFPILSRQGRVAQRDDHAVTRLALGVAVRLQKLEHSSRRGMLAPEKHFVLGATVGGRTGGSTGKTRNITL